MVLIIDPTRVQAMRAVAVACLLTSLLLSGCTAQDKEATDVPATPTATFTVVGDNRIAPTMTDTFHFLAKPRLTPLPPDAHEPVRVPVEPEPTTAVVGADEPTPWSFKLPNDLVGFVATATLYVEVKGTLTGNPFSQTPSGGCFWCLMPWSTGNSSGWAA